MHNKSEYKITILIYYIVELKRNILYNYVIEYLLYYVIKIRLIQSFVKGLEESRNTEKENFLYRYIGYRQ